MRPITDKESYLLKLEKSLVTDLDQKCHNVLVFIEETMAERLEKGNPSLEFMIPDAAWYDYLKTHVQFVKMRDWITEQYQKLGWGVQWYQDTNAITHEWTLVLS